MTLIAGATTRLARPRAASRTLRYVPSVAVLVDTLAISAATVLGVLGRSHLGLFEPSDATLRIAGVASVPLLLVWLGMIYLLRGYRENVFGAGTDEFKRVVNASLYMAAAVSSLGYLTRFPLSRGFFLITFLTGTALLLAGRLAIRHTLHRIRRRGGLRQRVLIVGTPSHVDEIAAVLRRESWLGYDIVGVLSATGPQSGTTYSGLDVLGGPQHLLDIAASDIADVVFFADGAIGTGEHMRRVVWQLEKHGVRLVVAPSVTDISSQRIRVRPVGGLPLMHISPPTAHDARSIGKRAFDLVGALGLLLLLAPVLLMIALRIRLHDGGPVLFRQTRTGLNGREFSCLKFRTMVTDAEERLAALKSQIGFDGGLFKMRDDPRITAPGKWLRRLSLDELPQLFNVVRGEMSLVGPRPPLPSEVADYDVDAVRRLHVRPGLTGLWQVSGRSDLSFEEALRLDLYYVDNWSMVQDLNILARTVTAVLGSRGAY